MDFAAITAENWERFIEFADHVMPFVVSIIVAIFGYMSNRREKATAEIIKSQKEAKDAADKLAEHDRTALLDRLGRIETQLSDLFKKFADLDERVRHFSSLDLQIERAISLSNINLKLSNSLSQVITSIGGALEATDSINSGTIKEELKRHSETQSKLLEDALSINAKKIY